MTDPAIVLNSARSAHARGDLQAAENLYRQILQVDPLHAASLHGMGVISNQAGRFAESVDYFHQLARIRPADPQAHLNLGLAQHANQKPIEAEQSWRKAIELKPDYAEAHNNLGNIHRARREYATAVECYRKAIAANPDFATSHLNLGHAFAKLGRHEDSISAYRHAVRLRPADAVAWYKLGFGLLSAHHFTEAIAVFGRAIELNPTYAEAHLDLGVCCLRRGEQEQALNHFQRALQLCPGSAVIWNSYLNALHYQPEVRLASLLAEHAKFEAVHAASLRTGWTMHENARDACRSLRVGFVSPNFAVHPVGYFMLGFIPHLKDFEIQSFCYSDTLAKDDMTDQIIACSRQWKDVSAWSDERLAEQIRSDKVDILFDLAGHTGGNRLLVFARRPAPIQITWMDYVGTTGLKAMDYILADWQEVPAGSEEGYSEKVLRMPDDYICYAPHPGAPPVGPLPARACGQITFGSFNLLSKISPATLQAWAMILQQVPSARLIIKYHGLEDPGTAERVRNEFARLNVDTDRIVLEGGAPHLEMFTHYQRIDIALDPFPYNGGLTTCEALWMGVPVITLPRETFAGRHGLTHLTTIGLTETISRDEQHYVQLAVELANDLPRLAAIRDGLRDRMAASPLCDGKRFAKHFTELMRKVWADFASSGSSSQA